MPAKQHFDLHQSVTHTGYTSLIKPRAQDTAWLFELDPHKAGRITFAYGKYTFDIDE